ncbi:hypothetical protein ACJX0J_036206 [Zea mays]
MKALKTKALDTFTVRGHASGDAKFKIMENCAGVMGAIGCITDPNANKRTIAPFISSTFFTRLLQRSSELGGKSNFLLHNTERNKYMFFIGNWILSMTTATICE